MKQIRRFTTGMLGVLGISALLFSSCSSDDDFTSDSGERVAVQFSTGLPATAKTRAASISTHTGITASGIAYGDYVADDGFATRAFYLGGTPQANNLKTAASGSQWVQNDQVGIFMLKSGQSLSATSIVDNADNKEYKAQAGGNATRGFTPADGTPIYYPQSGNVDFVAYYPYKTPLTNYVYPVNVSSQSSAADQAKVDVLYSKNATGKNKNSGAVNLQFNHALSKIIINLQAGAGMASANFSNASAMLKGFPTTADLALADGTTFTNVAGTSTAINSLKTITNSGFKATFEAILIPQSGTNTGRTVEFTVGGNKYTWMVADGATFTAGKEHTYDITVNESTITVGTCTITPWTGTGTVTPGTAEVLAVKIKAGTFLMGSPGGEPNRQPNETQHSVTLTKDFYMSKYQVTNIEYAAFLNAVGVDETRKYTVTGYGEQELFSLNQWWNVKWENSQWVPVRTDNVPMINVTWYGAKAFADWLGGSLPTEAQWEYACRAGTTTAYSYGDAANSDYMWYSGNSSSAPHPVGEKKANPRGLYDMHGNVYEWCLDKCSWPIADYGSSAVNDPVGTAGTYRVLRGGSWNFIAQYCRSAFRDPDHPDYARNYVGFRVAVVP